ncbi:MAG: hypothetical protein MK386_01665 [Candidatus Thioglobus autotrophicus]|jgi:hypothetical protein|nr:hypothetical protein [Candidatus Thioglobus autotrophicus]
MTNTLVLVKIGNGTFDQWKESFDDLAHMREKFSRDSMVGKVDDHTALVMVDVLTLQG